VEDSPRILDYGRTLGLQVINLIPFSVVSMRACFMPWLSMVIDPEGWVGPCNAALGGFGGRDRRFRFGNVRESRIEEIWKGCGFDTFRRGALRREHDVCGHRHCGDVTINAMNYIRGPCRNCSTGAPITYPFRRVTEIGRT
jgi:radical SAM protein with 4Fe4S-binding SPASM domain